ncbi:DUF5362 family protein [Mucilaginibacter ginkgonis]|uniref:Uncharacterized protein n=1 Tax=Mucilaginibacter ginkgonis TaxID=2682091 RepID=A0A6I4IP33_9SPHI|nr:DUF5362 family protein [Mucilaginibacter ginkgonis]QQL50771.1 hypothetical protein GO620_004755 [Mucilaginibacter ginkgonis]
MEETIITEHPVTGDGSHGIILTTEAQFYLENAGKWARFLGIMGFIGSALILIGAIFAGSFFEAMMRMSPTMPQNGPAVGGTTITVIYGLMALLYFFPALYLYRFGAAAGRGVVYSSQQEVTDAIKNLKSFMKFVGVLVIIGLVIGIISFGGIILGLMAGHAMR